MKIYVSVPVNNRSDLKVFMDALGDLSKKGHKVIDVYKNDSAKDAESIDYEVKKFKEMEKAIREADIVLIEASYTIRRSGFEIARALDEKKFVITLTDKKVKPNSPGILVGNPARNYTHKSYTKESINQVLDEALEQAKENLDTKFILIISPEIDKYLEWASAERRMHKAQVVREAIENMMNKDKDYKEFLKSID